MDDHLVIKEKLSRFVKDLKEQEFPTSTISIELAQFVASAMESYLDGKSKSLDIAFGLNPKRGAPGYKELKKATARKILDLKLEGKTQNQIADEIPRYDERELRRILDENIVEAIAGVLTERLNKADTEKSKK